MYHVYSVTITPTAGHAGRADIIVNGFDDKVLPASDTNRYVGLTRAELLADTLIDTAEAARDTRALNGREVLSVPVGAPALADIYKPATDHRGLNPRLTLLPEAAVIPAGGYLVLARGKTDSDPISGVVSVDPKIKEKKTAASLLYNVSYGFALSFPADDLSNFFRNGGTLQLLHADIAGNTAVATSGDDDTGYPGATTGAAVAGSVIISEIMWGLDAGEVESQYIELHNTTTADIGLDKQEWVIAVGAAASSHYTTIVDTVGNNPATGYWAPPGNGGVTVADPATPTVIDLVSMSRVTGAADGTAAASWAASIRPSLNLIGRRVGSPGAANNYVMTDTDDTDDTDDEDMTPPSAAVATAGDIMISEIMVASNDRRLPQWIELANVSGAAVSLSGWSLEIENDSDDDNVVGESIDLDLGDVEIGADQVALVVSKEGRDTSGIGDGDGDLRADRIIDVQNDVSPDNARYSLISEMGFMLSLIPPQTGAVRTPGDVVGNLDGGWELPMSEDGRSSLIRREMDDAAMATMGTDAAGWVLASDTGSVVPIVRPTTVMLTM